MAKTELNAVVTQKIEHAPGLMTIRVAPSNWELQEFIPGQYVVLALPVGILFPWQFHTVEPRR